ncbi:hypothetical protein [Fimbriimonas ginsengisoli]|uniref:Uncharacterized protein n=1 Tax=Fimbriimonas ginsengisoli Gsoil 348 TaxID=661478 RepID=A0A068NS20_FIMGI|nr:hypothetical protein [Fimbriimonas ginsengisoli]AIE84414.1 hypothetical protein OP10G_1046 [Fimbriimonas ginsengisoli Gsoil 348]
MKLIRYLLYAVAVATIVACGGGGSGTTFDRQGVLFAPNNPQGVLAGTAVDLLLVTTAVNSTEPGHTFTANVDSSDIPSIDHRSWTGTVGPVNAVDYHVITVHIPDGLAEGTHLHLQVARSSETSPISLGLVSSYELIVGSSTVVGAFQGQGPVSGNPGSTVTGTLTLTSIGSAHGLVEFTGQLGGVSVNPQSGNIAANGALSATVSYHIPATATPGSTIDVPVFFRARTNDGFAMLHVQVAGNLPGDFTFGTSTNSVLLTPGATSQAITVTANPQNGFTGLITVTATATDPRVTLSSPTTNPFTINVASASPGTTTIHLQMSQQGQGQGQSSVTLSATGGGHTHTATIQVQSS